MMSVLSAKSVILSLFATSPALGTSGHLPEWRRSIPVKMGLFARSSSSPSLERRSYLKDLSTNWSWFSAKRRWKRRLTQYAEKGTFITGVRPRRGAWTDPSYSRIDIERTCFVWYLFIVTSYILTKYEGSHVTPSRSFVLRYASRHSLVLYRTLVVEVSSCMRAKRFATSVSFVVSLPFTQASLEITL